MTETALKNKIIAMIKSEYPTVVFCLKLSDQFYSGYPDLVMSANGRFVAMEIKRDEKSRARPLQIWTLEQIRNAGGVAEVVRSVSEAREILRNVCTKRI